MKGLKIIDRYIQNTKEVLDMISGHVETGEKLPDELLNKLIDSKNYHSAMGMIRQLEFSLFDFLSIIQLKYPKNLLDVFK